MRDDLDDLIDEYGIDVEKLSSEILNDPIAPPGQRCDAELHVGLSGVWRCDRARGHTGACRSLALAADLGPATPEDPQ